MYTSWLGSAGRLLKRNGMNGTFGTDATALRLDNLIFNPTQGSRSGNLGLEGGTALRLGEFDIQPDPGQPRRQPWAGGRNRVAVEELNQ